MIKNCILLTGEDDFRLRERAKFYRTAFQNKYSDGEISTLEKDDSLHDLENIVMTPNLFGGRRLVLLDGFWDTDKFERAKKTEFFEKLPDFESQCTVLVIDPKPDKRTKYCKFILDQAKVESFDLFDENQLIQWIQNYTEKKGGKIMRGSAQTLLKRCGENLWNLSREIEKLVQAGEGEITDKLILELTIPHPSVVMWDFLESLSKKSVQLSMKRLKDLIDSGVSAYEVLSMIFREVRIHAQIRSGIDQGMGAQQIATETRLHPFVVKKTYSLSQQFSKEKIEQMYEILFQIDKKIKTGKLSLSTDDTSELELAIEKFILFACK
jgi:DNA polymerase III subunit delta